MPLHQSQNKVVKQILESCSLQTFWGPKRDHRSKSREEIDDIVLSVGKPQRMALDAQGPLSYLAPPNNTQKPCER